jgi:hypothetical protein
MAEQRPIPTLGKSTVWLGGRARAPFSFFSLLVPGSFRIVRPLELVRSESEEIVDVQQKIPFFPFLRIHLD